MDDLDALVGRTLTMRDRLFAQTGLQFTKVRLHPQDVHYLRSRYEIKPTRSLYPDTIVHMAVVVLGGIPLEESESVAKGTSELVITLS